MSKKNKSPEQRLAELRHQQMQASGYIRNQYPQVKEIVFDFTFEDFDAQVGPSRQKLKWGPEHPAFFQFDCPYHECVNGGFNLHPEIVALIAGKKPDCAGELRCQGWQDRERVGKHHCYCKLIYKISVTYAQ